ncbi:Neurotransmitter-gated ion-channel ligand binding domain protein [Paragonimus heterotremus]|uniref:Neurotransmitter-gated ion-channel ligand binding domain protein n=1 Tax=Paragonimus heterotremus TaxID=100268 RepID=A0A8J4T7A0_9TREM|nr:Neurotransmitter-gated ion-channel ligand binding domain protein [Paragonimus heterotremus]
MNGKSSTDFDFSANVRGRLTVDSNGDITWLHGAVLDTTCPLDVAFFPFDYQTCFLILTPWQSGVKQLLLKPFTHGSTVDNSYLPNSNVSEWEIQSVHFSSRKYRSDLNVTYQYVSIGIHLKRQPLYFVVLVLVPFSMLSALACLIFTLDDTGDRLSVALSLVLSMTMYVVIVSTNAPRSMRTLPVLGIFLLDQLGLLSIATVLAVINNKLYQATDLVSWQDWIYTISGTGASKGSEESHQPFGFNMYVDNSARARRGSRWLQANQAISNPMNSSRARETERKLSNRILELPNSSPTYIVRNSSYDRSIAIGKYLSKSGSEFELPPSDNSPESIVVGTAYRMAPNKSDTNLMQKTRRRSRILNTKGDKGGWLEANLSTRNSSSSPPFFQHRHHPMCNNVMQPALDINNCSKCAQKYTATNTTNRSPWVEPLTLAPSHTSSNSSFCSSVDSFCKNTEFSPSRLFQTTLTATAAAAYAATKVLQNQSNSMAVRRRNQLASSKLSRSYKHHSADGLRNKKTKYTDGCKPTEDDGDNETQEALHISTTARLAASAVIAAFQAAEQLDKRNQHQLRIDRIYPKSRRKPVRKMTDRRLMYPYRQLASRMDCVQLVAYLLLSTINAIVCLVIMPQFSQDNQPPKQWIQ